MRQYVWGWIGSPYSAQDNADPDTADSATGDDNLVRWDELKLVDQAATIVAMRAAAGDHVGEASIGEALHRAGMSDRRLMRLLTAGKSQRLEDLNRALRLIGAASIGLDWSPREVRNVFDFLFGSDRAAQRAANNWAGDFFKRRGKTQTPDEEAAIEEETTDAG